MFDQSGSHDKTNHWMQDKSTMSAKRLKSWHWFATFFIEEGAGKRCPDCAKRLLLSSIPSVHGKKKPAEEGEEEERGDGRSGVGWGGVGVLS